MLQRLQDRGVQLRSVQVQFSLLSAQATGEDALLKICRAEGIEVLAYSPLAFGILCQPPATKPRADTRLRRRIEARLLPESEALRTEIQRIAVNREVSMTQVALNWCRAQGTTPIPGLRTPEQARDVAGALQWSLTSAELEQLTMARKQCKVRTPSNPFQSA